MKFKLFGGLDCPDHLLFQLSILSNPEIVTMKALSRLVEHVIYLLLITPNKQLINDEKAVVSSDKSNEIDNINCIDIGNISINYENTFFKKREYNKKFFLSAISPLYNSCINQENVDLTVSTSPLPLPSQSSFKFNCKPHSYKRDKLDGFAIKCVNFFEASRLRQAKEALAAARRFVLKNKTDNNKTDLSSLNNNEDMVASSLITELSLEQKVSLVRNYLAQVLVAIDTVIRNMIKYKIDDENTVMKELTMLGLSPDAVNVILYTLNEVYFNNTISDDVDIDDNSINEKILNKGFLKKNQKNKEDNEFEEEIRTKNNKNKRIYGKNAINCLYQAAVESSLRIGGCYYEDNNSSNNVSYPRILCSDNNKQDDFFVYDDKTFYKNRSSISVFPLFQTSLRSKISSILNEIRDYYSEKNNEQRNKTQNEEYIQNKKKELIDIFSSVSFLSAKEQEKDELEKPGEINNTSMIKYGSYLQIPPNKAIIVNPISGKTRNTTEPRNIFLTKTQTLVMFNELLLAREIMLGMDIKEKKNEEEEDDEEEEDEEEKK